MQAKAAAEQMPSDSEREETEKEDVEAWPITHTHLDVRCDYWMSKEEMGFIQSVPQPKYLFDSSNYSSLNLKRL